MENSVARIAINFSNETVSTKEDDDGLCKSLKPVLEATFIFVLVIVILAISCDITPQQLCHHVKNPTGIFCGMFSQFILMPLSAYTVNAIFHLKPTYAVGALILSCCPGGPLSNTFSYFLDGDLALSVTMTTLSTLLDLGFLPLNIWIYGHSAETGSLIIPYRKIALTLLYISSPILVGMVIRWKAKRIAHYITKVGSYIAAGLIFICLIIQVILCPSMFSGAPWQLFIAALLLPCLGLIIGYLLSFLLRQSVPVRKTVAMECSIQNAPLALAISAISFSGKEQLEISAFPTLYGFFMIAVGTLACLAYEGYRRLCDKKNSGSEDATDGSAGLLLEKLQEETQSNELTIIIANTEDENN